MNKYVARICRRPMQTGFMWKSARNRSFSLYGRIILKLILNIQGVTGGMCESSGEFSLGQTIPI